MINRTLSFILKGISLLIIDVVTLMLVFSIWSIVNLLLFPWAFIAILFSLTLINILVIASSKCIKAFGVAIFSSAIAITSIFFLFVMIFTGITYVGITPKWYVIFMLLATLFYILIMYGLYYSGINKSKNHEQHEQEQLKRQEITMQLTAINENLYSNKSFMEQSNYLEIMEQFVSMKERLEASTPFGRIPKMIVVNIENQITSKLFKINEYVVSLASINEKQAICKTIAELLIEVRLLVINREKLIIQ